MRLYIIVSIFLTLEYAYNTDLLTHQYTGNNSECLTDELYGDFTVEEYNNLVKRRKFIREKMRNKLFRTEIDTLIIPIVFHNYYQVNDGEPSRSFCDYVSGNNDSGVYTSNNDALICNQRAEEALEILNEQFASALIKFIPPRNTSLVVEDIKGNETLFIWKDNWTEIRANNNIDNTLNIYIDYCIGRTNTITEILECGTVSAMTLYPENISSTSPPGLAITHSAFPGIDNNSTGIFAHEIGHMFTLRHLYHLPLTKNKMGTETLIDDIYEVVSDFKRELVSGTECNSRGDMICDTPGQPLQDINLTFDQDNCIYYGFGGEYDPFTNILKIGGSNKTGTYRDDFGDSTNLISHSNFDDVGNFWGTRGVPDSCYLNNQGEYSTECIDTLYNYLPIAANFLQWSSIMNNCLNEQDIGFTPEQLANIRYSIEHDYTACYKEEACNTGSSALSNIPPSDLFLDGESSCKFPCELDGGCLVTDAEYQSDYSLYTCSGISLGMDEKIIPKIFSIENIYPNPFNPSAQITYGLRENSFVTISIYDITGRQLTTLIYGFQTLGNHSVTWNASTYPSGIYFITISSPAISESRKIVLIK